MNNKTLLGLAVTGAVAGVFGPALFGRQNTGLQQYGTYLTKVATNATVLGNKTFAGNGTQSNGTATNGTQSNGTATNETQPNGTVLGNETQSNGTATNGTQSNGNATDETKIEKNRTLLTKNLNHTK